MSERVRTTLFTILWGVLVIAALVTLWLGYMNSNIVLVALAVVATFAVMKTHQYVPLPKVYTEKGITNDIFISRRQRLLNEKKRSGSAE